ncbi:MAG: hypothetical protein BGO77_07800 [Caedibacter sp. 37-49]|nr:MAG: hypothetical protein BGO77_07800 [Caedibacter sp. 37-49]
MRCSAYCTAKTYDLHQINEFLRSRCPTTLYQDVIHFRFKKGEVFCFNYGCIIFWNLSEEEERESLKYILKYEIQPLKTPEFDEFSFNYGNYTRMSQDEITLADAQDSLLKLAISYGLAQSVKLLVYERRIESAIEDSSLITQALAKKGKVPLSRKEIGRKIGALFFERSSINLQSDFLDTPEFFWENSEYEATYRQAAKELDIKSRTQSLNRKLEMIHELFQILGDELNHRHSTRLEWIIIILILFEVLLAISTSYDHLISYLKF